MLFYPPPPPLFVVVLDDDSSQLPEVLELFSDVTLPIKVDRLMKVRETEPETSTKDVSFILTFVGE